MAKCRQIGNTGHANDLAFAGPDFQFTSIVIGDLHVWIMTTDLPASKLEIGGKRLQLIKEMKEIRIKNFEQKLAKPAKKPKMFCDFCVWRERQPSKIAKRCSLKSEETKGEDGGGEK